MYIFLPGGMGINFIKQYVGAGLGIVWEEVDRSTGRAASWPAYRSKVIAAWSAKHGVAA